MKANDGMKRGRRDFLRMAGSAAAGLALATLPYAVRTASSAAAGLKIGIVGSGRIGGTLGELWLKAGHEVMFSSLDLEHDKALAARLGGKARAGTSKEAAAFGEVILIAVPYAALPQVGRDLAGLLKGKVVVMDFWPSTTAWYRPLTYGVITATVMAMIPLGLIMITPYAPWAGS